MQTSCADTNSLPLCFAGLLLLQSAPAADALETAPDGASRRRRETAREGACWRWELNKWDSAHRSRGKGQHAGGLPSHALISARKLPASFGSWQRSGPPHRQDGPPQSFRQAARVQSISLLSSRLALLALLSFSISLSVLLPSSTWISYASEYAWPLFTQAWY